MDNESPNPETMPRPAYMVQCPDGQVSRNQRTAEFEERERSPPVRVKRALKIARGLGNFGNIRVYVEKPLLNQARDKTCFDFGSPDPLPVAPFAAGCVYLGAASPTTPRGRWLTWLVEWTVCVAIRIRFFPRSASDQGLIGN